MAGWDSYEARMKLKGQTRREASGNKALNFINYKAGSSLSYQEAVIAGCERKIVVINQDKLFLKRIIAMPGETLERGAVVNWAGYSWLIIEVDAHQELYAAGRMQQCNFVLKWVGRDRKIITRPCVIEDGTNYLIGEKEREVMSIGDARMTMTISKDSETMLFKRGNRFLIDDPDGGHGNMLVYEITKPNKLYGLYNGQGIYRFLLTETNSTDYDCKELMVADYYKHFPREGEADPNAGEKEGWL